MDFNKQRMLDNISFLLKEKKKKIGELESECGVSAGYISRTAKDNAAKPGIDFVVNAAATLGVSIDTLLKLDLASLTPTERYLISFIEKLKADTNGDKLAWKKQTAEHLNNVGCDDDGFPLHPLFTYETFFVQGEVYPEQVTEIVFCSSAFGYKTRIADDCFCLPLKDRSTLYLMAIKNIEDSACKSIELWMNKPGVGSEYLCGLQDDSALACLVDDLYLIVKAYSKHPNIDKRLRSVIDAFMADDFEDASDDPFSSFASSEDLPF